MQPLPPPPPTLPHPHPSLRAFLHSLFLHPKISEVVLFFLIQWGDGWESGEWHQRLMMNILSVPRVPLSVSEWLVWCLQGLFNGTSNLEPVEGGTSHTYKQRGRAALVLKKMLRIDQMPQPITAFPHCDTARKMSHYKFSKCSSGTSHNHHWSVSP